MSFTVAVVGAGPAGLMAAEVLSQQGLGVDVYDAMPSAGRKFLLAGRSGLNLTHSEAFEPFMSRYGHRRTQFEPLLRAFGPVELCRWAKELGIETFVGTSGRIFPTAMKGSPLLRAWLGRLSAGGVRFHLRHRCRGWNSDRSLQFETPQGRRSVQADAVVLALGGGSWARLGSDGAWVHWLRQAGVPVESLRPANCGFDVDWSPHFRERFDGQPVKSVVLTFESFSQQGEFVVTQSGIQGSLIYAASARIREALELRGRAVISLDLAPDRSHAWLVERLDRTRGTRSLANHLEKTVGMKGLKAGLLYEFMPKADLLRPDRTATFIKQMPIPLTRPRPLDEAISSAGGVGFEALDPFLMLREIPGVFCAGEMLDWEAPTGGYLLTGCLASGRAAGLGVVNWLRAPLG
jgi:hypothetical protein